MVSRKKFMSKYARKKIAGLARANELLAKRNLALRGEFSQCASELEEAEQRLKLLNERIQDELIVAHEVQQGLLPPARPAWDEPELVCYNMPAREVGGDFYTYYSFDTRLRVSRERFAIAVGDVSGKGMAAALLMAISLSSFETIINQVYSLGKLVTDSLTSYSLDTLLTDLDKALAPYTAATRQNCAIVYIELTKSARTGRPVAMRAVNAGCVMPLIRRADGTVEWVEAEGLPLGIGLSARFGYEEVTRNLNKGDMVILSSDGVIEANNAAEEMFGFDRLERTVISGPNDSAAAMFEHLKTTVESFVGDTEPHDDLTMVVVQV